MTKKWSNTNLPGALHFITGSFVHRIPVFTQDPCCEAFLEVCSTLLHEWPCKLISFVLMPDHFHLILNPRDGDIKGFTGSLKGIAAQRIIEMNDDERVPEHQLWQESFKALPLWSLWMIWQKINYIHANPVEARIVSSARDYRWSSFRDFYFNSGEPVAVDHDWWWPEDTEKLDKAMREIGWGTVKDRNIKT